MNHAAVVTGLVPRERVFFLQQYDRCAWPAPRQFKRCGQSDNAATNDAKVIFHGELSRVSRVS
jgi:hypothetical protein